MRYLEQKSCPNQLLDYPSHSQLLTFLFLIAFTLNESILVSILMHISDWFELRFLLSQTVFTLSNQLLEQKDIREHSCIYHTSFVVVLISQRHLWPCQTARVLYIKPELNAFSEVITALCFCEIHTNLSHAKVFKAVRKYRTVSKQFVINLFNLIYWFIIVILLIIVIIHIFRCFFNWVCLQLSV